MRNNTNKLLLVAGLLGALVTLHSDIQEYSLQKGILGINDGEENSGGE